MSSQSANTKLSSSEVQQTELGELKMSFWNTVHQAVAGLGQTFSDITLPQHGQRSDEERGAPFFREILALLEPDQCLIGEDSSRLSASGESLIQVGSEQLPAELVRSTMIALDWLRQRDSAQPSKPSAVRALFDLAHADKPVDPQFFDRLTEVGLGKIDIRIAWDAPNSGQLALPKLDRTFVPHDHVLSVVRAGTWMDDNKQVVLVNPEINVEKLEEALKLSVDSKIGKLIQQGGNQDNVTLVHGVPANDFLDIYHRVNLLMSLMSVRSPEKGPFGISTVKHLYNDYVTKEDSQKEPSALQDYEKRLAAVYGLGTVELGKNGGEVTFYPREHLAQVLEEVIQYEGQGRDLVLYPLPLLAKIT
jgi:hypothetical protein